MTALGHATTLAVTRGVRASASIVAVTRELAIELPGLSVGALAWGPDDGPLALLLHGFPDTAWSWRVVGPALAADGWRVVAPFARGYAPTERARDGSYQVGALVHDVVDLHRTLGGDAGALLVGHDWGAITAYGVASFAPQLFGRLVAMSVPPVATMQRVVRGRLALRQLRNSWYILANQVPGLAESAFEPLVRKLWADWSPGYDATEELAHLLEALPDRARRTAAIRYYRALVRPWGRRAGYADAQNAWLRTPSVPMLYLHGAQDGCLLPAVGAEAAVDLPIGSRAVLIPGAGHFLQLEQPDAVAGEIRRFVPAPTKGTAL